MEEWPLSLPHIYAVEGSLWGGYGNDSLYDLGTRLTDNHWPPWTLISKFKRRKIKHKGSGVGS